MDGCIDCYRIIGQNRHSLENILCTEYIGKGAGGLYCHSILVELDYEDVESLGRSILSVLSLRRWCDRRCDDYDMQIYEYEYGTGR